MKKEQWSNVIESAIALVILYALAELVPMVVEWISAFADQK